jgi:hypothetical protein
MAFSEEKNMLNNIYTEIIVDNPNGGVSKYYTFSEIDVFNQGLIKEAIIGINKDKNSTASKINPESFLENTVFKKLMHKVIKEETPNILAFQRELRKQGDGYIYVIDRRGNTGEGKTHNIIGAFKIKNSKVVEYEINKNHRLFTEEGFFILDSYVEKKLIEKIESYYKK